ncbi:hypothetical protein AQUCO_00700609v1 [Aquilegia coerulea]|uniref:Succinate dehydrogenase subunit 5, mitochondrial n=1 Tax=Aquilegia coerulea TaxID=218851 RepID=A0A2G5EKW5_AQUCA|nr:hypothetical protein AQUCO_00700609v1 [Aquilegia coerulea]
MEKFVLLRSIYRSTCIRFARFSSINEQQLCNGIRHYSNPISFHFQRSIFSLSPTSSISPSINRVSFDCRPPFAIGVGNMRSFSEDVSHMPVITDPDVKNAFKELMAVDWDELPAAVIHDAKAALSKNTDDKSGQEALANVFRAAEAVEQFSGHLISLKMELDDSVGMSGENVRPLSDEFSNALLLVHQRYTDYLESFGPDETYLRKKVETELGTKLIFLKMRCSGLGSEWGKVMLFLFVVLNLIFELER